MSTGTVPGGSANDVTVAEPKTPTFCAVDTALGYPPEIHKLCHFLYTGDQAHTPRGLKQRTTQLSLVNKAHSRLARSTLDVDPKPSGRSRAMNRRPLARPPLARGRPDDDHSHSGERD